MKHIPVAVATGPIDHLPCSAALIEETPVLERESKDHATRQISQFTWRLLSYHRNGTSSDPELSLADDDDDDGDMSVENTPELVLLCRDLIRLYEERINNPECWKNHRPWELDNTEVTALASWQVRSHYWVHAPISHFSVVAHDPTSLSLSEWVWLANAYGQCVAYPSEVSEDAIIEPATILGSWARLLDYTRLWTLSPWDGSSARKMHDSLVATTVWLVSLSHHELSSANKIGLCAVDDPVLVDMMMMRRKSQQRSAQPISSEELAAETPFSTAASAEIEHAARSASSLAAASAFATDLARALAAKPPSLREHKRVAHGGITEGHGVYYDEFEEDMTDNKVRRAEAEYEHDEREMLMKLRTDASLVDHEARVVRSESLAGEALEQWVPRCADVCSHINLFELLFDRYPPLPLPKAGIIETPQYAEFAKWMGRRCAESFDDYRRDACMFACELALPLGTFHALERRRGQSAEDMQTLFHKHYKDEFDAFNDASHKLSSSEVYADSKRPGRMRYIRDAFVLFLYDAHFANRLNGISFRQRYFIGTQHVRRKALRIMLQRMGSRRRTPLIVQIGGAYYVHDNIHFYETEDIMHALWYWTMRVKEERGGILDEGEDIGERWIRHLEAEDVHVKPA